MADALISVALETLILEIRRAYGEIRGVKEELEKLKETLSLINEVLEDAERKQFKDKAVHNWLRRLRDVAYDAEDILEEWATKARKQDDESQSRIFTSVSNSISLHFKLRKKIKKIKERFDGIIKQSSDFHLMKRVANDGKEVGESSRTPTDSLVTESEIWGRDNDKKNVIELLLDGINNEKDVFVLPIVGMGGLGKTTLAQLVYNDQHVVDRFDLRMWVCVSENFELKRLASAIYESASGTSNNLGELDPLQKALQEKLKGKKFLLVLDDVWNENIEKWDRLKRILNCSKESAIIVTTRIESIASMMGSRSQYYKLEVLSDDYCWTLFEHRAFGGGSGAESPNLEAIGKLIVKKCGGVPLAIKAIGSLLSSESDEKVWINIRDNETWFPSAETDILPALRLSYDHLPFQWRRCFAYISIFPKDHVIYKDNLICLWIANDFILTKPGKELEDVGNDIFNELVGRSLLQGIKRDRVGNIISCQMHDLLHDLGRDILGNEFFTFEKGKVGDVPKETRHLVFDKKIIHKSLCDARKIRTLLHESYGAWECLNFINQQHTSNLRWLRSLYLSGCYMNELPDSIGKLLHLRYLNLSSNSFETLPESLINLQNLQFLILNNCEKLLELPKGTEKMSRLRHLDVSGCKKLIAMPNKIGQLTCLQILPTFVVGNGSECGISQLGDLNQLRGELSIMHLERDRNGKDPQEAKLFSKKNLRVLKLSWDEDLDDGKTIKSEESLNNLRPCEKLEELMIYRYLGNQFSSWLEASLVPNLVAVHLDRCYNCQSLPPLGQLLHLKYLHIKDMHAVKYIGVDFYGEDKSESFPSLQEFTLIDMHNLEEWSFVEDKRIVFRCLNKLTIENLWKLPCFPEGLLRYCTKLKTLVLQDCRKLRTLGRELDNLVALESLEILLCAEMEYVSEEGIRGLTYLKELKIWFCEKLRTISPVLEGLPSLMTLHIWSCENLMSLPEGMGQLIHLEILLIAQCDVLTSFPQEGIGWLTSLKYLSLERLPNLTSVPEGLGQLIHLEGLEINECDVLTSFPQEVIGGLTSLKYLSLRRLPNLTFVLEGLGQLIHLKTLELIRLPNLTFVPEELGQLIHLESLEIDGCDVLTSFPQEVIGGLTSLKKLTLTRLHNLTSVPEGHGGLDSLKELTISYFPKLSILPATLLRLTTLKELTLWYFDSLNFSMPEGGLPSLKMLEIKYCENLTSLPEEGVRGLTALEVLKITACPKLSTLPAALQHLTSLRELHIGGCHPELLRQVESKRGEEWLKIAHIPKVYRYV